MNEVKIKDSYIKLNQFLKFTGLISTGGEVKYFIEDNNITLNGEEVFELRKKIYVGDKLVINNDEYKIVSE